MVIALRSHLFATVVAGSLPQNTRGSGLMASPPLCGENLPQKPLHALVHFNGPPGGVVSIVNDDCFKCSYWDTCIVNGTKNESHVWSGAANAFRYLLDGKVIYEGSHNFENLGVYSVTPTKTSYEIDITEKPIDKWIQILLSIILLIVPLVMDRIAEALFSRFYKPIDHNTHNQFNDSNSRIVCLDAIRGYALVLMIFVNYGGGGLISFAHSPWFGLTIADTVFPLFMFCTGAALYHTLKDTTVFDRFLFWKIFFRNFRLIFIGIILSNSATDPPRLPGVLQRIGFACQIFFVVHATVHFYFELRCQNNRELRYEAEPTYIGYLQLMMAVACAVTGILIMLFPVDHCPIGYMGPGGISEMGQYYNCTGGMARVLDLIFGGLVYQTPTCKEMYHTIVAFDPEGIVGTINSVVTICGGYCAYKLLSSVNDDKNLIYGLVTVFLLLIGICLHISWIPLCKNLWSLSYVLLNTGIDMILLWFMHYVASETSWFFKSLCAMGKNSLLIYILHEVSVNRFPVHFNFPTSTTFLLLNCLWGVFFHIIIAFVLEFGEYKAYFDPFFGIEIE